MSYNHFYHLIFIEMIQEPFGGDGWQPQDAFDSRLDVDGVEF